MNKNMSSSLSIPSLLGAALGFLLAFAPASWAVVPEEPEYLPIIFVHGLAGSGQQYQTQAMRFASNGYPDDRILAFEYDTGGIAQVIGISLGTQNTPLTNFIDAVRAEFGVDRVHLVAHSMGATVVNQFLGNAARADRVASYIGIDGASNANCGISGTTAHMQCMGIFVGGSSNNVGGNNFQLPPQTHVEVVTSEESFALQYKFFTGEDPKTTLVLPERPRDVTISGRVVNFPANTGPNGATLEIWEISRTTGERRFDTPTHSVPITASGNFGPLQLRGAFSYEYLVRRPGFGDFHNYTQPLIRSTNLARLLVPVGDIVTNTHTGPNHAAAAILRNREFWSSHPSGDNDILTIATLSATQGNHPPVQVFTSVTANNINGVHVHDAAASPTVSTLDLLPYFPSQPFQTGVDVYMPATEPTDGRIRFVNFPRGDTSRRQVINTPNWVSQTDLMLLVFNDYIQDINNYAECRALEPSPCD